MPIVSFFTAWVDPISNGRPVTSSNLPPSSSLPLLSHNSNPADFNVKCCRRRIQWIQDRRFLLFSFILCNAIVPCPPSQTRRGHLGRISDRDCGRRRRDRGCANKDEDWGDGHYAEHPIHTTDENNDVGPNFIARSPIHFGTSKFPASIRKFANNSSPSEIHPLLCPNINLNPKQPKDKKKDSEIRLLSHAYLGVV